MSCEYKDTCLSQRCFVCDNLRLLKLPEDKKRKQLQSKANRISKKKDNADNSMESWKDLESTVASKISAMPTTKQYNDMREANRQVRSGAIWFMPGDVDDPIILAECKERSTITAKGEKSITIPRSWLTKIKAEAELTGKYPCFAFRYKNDDVVYMCNEFDVLCDMITEIKFLRVDNANLKNEKNKYRALALEQEKEITELKEQLAKYTGGN